MFVVSAPSQVRRVRSNCIRSAFVSQRLLEAIGAAGWVFEPGLAPRLIPWEMWVRLAPVPPGPYSAFSTPMRLRRHSSESAPPVAIAMFGMSPSLWFFGRRRTDGAAIFVTAADAGLSLHLLTVGMTYCIRHLPTCTTSGMLLPSGTPVMVNLPSASVTAKAMPL